MWNILADGTRAAGILFLLSWYHQPRYFTFTMRYGLLPLYYWEERWAGYAPHPFKYLNERRNVKPSFTWPWECKEPVQRNNCSLVLLLSDNDHHVMSHRCCWQRVWSTFQLIRSWQQRMISMYFISGQWQWSWSDFNETS